MKAFLIVFSIWSILVQAISSQNAGRIIGGELAEAGQFPFIAAIYADLPGGKYFCSGTLVVQTMNDLWFATQAEWILTVGQCVIGATQFTISLGSHLLTGDDPNRVTVTATNYFLWPDHDPTILWHDIALIKLDQPITLTEYIKPILYAPMGYLYPGNSLTTLGWGQISDSNTELTEELRHVNVAIIDQFECRDFYGEQLYNDMICTIGGTNEGICIGDIGGPLISLGLVYKNTTLTTGVASFVSGNGCESTNPKGYTRVDSYKDWIDTTIRNN